MNAKKVTTHLLLAFTLVSIGFAIGKETTLRGTRTVAASAPAATTQAARADRVIVYYMHQTFRCVTCNRIEAMTAEVVRNRFAKELTDGQVEWRLVNFQENEELARRYNVGSSSVVVVQMRAGAEKAHRTLDQVWTLAGQPDLFAAYVGDAIHAYAIGEVPQ